jgi:hypothetical protein
MLLSRAIVKVLMGGSDITFIENPFDSDPREGEVNELDDPNMTFYDDI